MTPSCASTVAGNRSSPGGGEGCREAAVGGQLEPNVRAGAPNVNGLPSWKFSKFPRRGSRTCNDTLLGALLASASDSEGVPQPVHARARPPSAPCGTQEPPLVAPSARRCTAAQSISAQRTATEWRRAAHAHAGALSSMRSRLGCPALGQDHGGCGQLDTEPNEKWAKREAACRPKPHEVDASLPGGGPLRCRGRPSQ